MSCDSNINGTTLTDTALARTSPSQASESISKTPVSRRRRRRGHLVALAAALCIGAAAPASALAGNWEWWGYRTNSYQTWALATQTPSVSVKTIPGFREAVWTMGWSWRWNAQGARMIGKCTGITWSASPIYVGCSNR